VLISFPERVIGDMTLFRSSLLLFFLFPCFSCLFSQDTLLNKSLLIPGYESREKHSVRALVSDFSREFKIHCECDPHSVSFKDATYFTYRYF